MVCTVLQVMRCRHSNTCWISAVKGVSHHITTEMRAKVTKSHISMALGQQVAKRQPGPKHTED